MSEEKLAIYARDGDFYRYRDGLMWGRFQTAATIDGAMLYGLYGTGVTVSPAEMALLAVAVTLVVAMICRFAWKDVVDCRAHLKRIKAFENEAGVPYSIP